MFVFLLGCRFVLERGPEAAAYVKVKMMGQRLHGGGGMCFLLITSRLRLRPALMISMVKMRRVKRALERPAECREEVDRKRMDSR